MALATRVPCPDCGEVNHLGRALLSPTGMHLRCRGCRRSRRLVDSVSGIFMPMLALALVYALGFWALLGLWPPADWTGATQPVMVAALPFLLAVPAGWWALAVARSGRSDEDIGESGQRLSPLVFALVYVTAAGVSVGMLVLLAFAALLSSDIPSVATPRPVLPDEPEQIVVEGLADWSATELDGTPRRLGDLQGRPILFCLWKPDEPLVLPTLKSLQRLRKRVDEVWFVIAAQGSEGEARRFIEVSAPRLPHCLAGQALPPGLEELLGETGPAVFLLDSEGRVAAWHCGAADWDQANVKRFFEQLRRP